MKFLFKWEERVVGISQVQAIGHKTGQCSLDRSHLLERIGPGHQPQAEDICSTGAKTLDGPHEEQFHHAWRSCWCPAREIERPSPCSDSFWVVACRNVRHTPIDGGKGQKCACGACTGHGNSGQKARDDAL